MAKVKPSRNENATAEPSGAEALHARLPDVWGEGPEQPAPASAQARKLGLIDLGAESAYQTGFLSFWSHKYLFMHFALDESSQLVAI